MPCHADDRVNDYQHYAADAVQSCQQYADMGAQVRKLQSWDTVNLSTSKLMFFSISTVVNFARPIYPHNISWVY